MSYTPRHDLSYYVMDGGWGIEEEARRWGITVEDVAKIHDNIEDKYSEILRTWPEFIKSESFTETVCEWFDIREGDVIASNVGPTRYALRHNGTFEAVDIENVEASYRFLHSITISQAPVYGVYRPRK